MNPIKTAIRVEIIAAAMVMAAGVGWSMPQVISYREHLALSDRRCFGASRQLVESRDDLTNTIRKIPDVLGDGIKKMTEPEREVAKKLRYWET